MNTRCFVPCIIAITLAATIVHADEGMWLFNYPPKKILKEKHGFSPTDAWLAHLQQSAVRLNNGGSGSFVSANGLVMTNHHVGADALQKLSNQKRDLLRSGFYAKTRAEELQCPDSELNVLVSIEDVTKRVNAAVEANATPAEAEKQRRAAMNTIEKESLDKTGLRSDVITLYQGGLYHLYRYKKYTDVRLVFAPEQDIAFFGGDPDNFEYPRYDLDICFFRVYENGMPAKTPHYLKWNPAGLKADDLVFVAGNPGKTDRLNTVNHLMFLRDRILPSALDVLRRREVLLASFSQRSAENARRAKDLLFTFQNSRKARLGGLAGLQDPAVMKQKQKDEEAFLAAVAVSDRVELAGDCKTAMAMIDQSLRDWAEVRIDYDMLERGQAFYSELFMIARTLVRLAEETPKPNTERLREYRESNLDSLKQELFSEAPIYADLQTALLADSLSMFLERKTSTFTLRQNVMTGKSPERRAAELVRGTKLADVAERRRLAEGGRKAIEASRDPMILLARLVDKPAREVRTTYEQKVEEPQRVAYGKLANAQFDVRGTEIYPDATFTLRLAFGVVKGFDAGGQQVPAWTTLEGLYRRAAEHDSREPYALPKIWIDRKNRLDLTTPMNFICTADIIGGNSGSPVVDRNGQLVGIIFDGNMPSLVWDYVFSETEGRAVAVHGSAILEALRKIYDAGPLADELAGSLTDAAANENSPAGALNEASVIAIARRTVASNDTWSKHAEYATPQQKSDGSWHVLVRRLPEVTGGHRIIVIDKKGSVTAYIRGL